MHTILQIPGYAYLSVTNKNDDGIPDGWIHAPDDAEDGYEFVQSRGLIVIDTKYQLDEHGNEIELSPQDPNYIGKVSAHFFTIFWSIIKNLDPFYIHK